MEEQKLQGKNFLKVCGIIMIVGGALGLIVSIVAILGVAGLAYLSDGQLEMGMLYASSILALVASVVELVTGIVGVKNCKKPEKATSCMVWGIIVAVLTIAGEILGVAGGGSFSVINLILGLVLPVLFIIGAALNKKAA